MDENSVLSWDQSGELSFFEQLGKAGPPHSCIVIISYQHTIINMLLLILKQLLIL